MPSQLRNPSLILALSLISHFSVAQIYPVSLGERINNSTYIIQGLVKDQSTYLDPLTGNVLTLNAVQVNAWLKNGRNDEKVYVITVGGVFGNKATIQQHALKLHSGSEYIFFLEQDNGTMDSEEIRNAEPGRLQVRAYSDMQGAMLYQFGLYHDALSESDQDESQILSKIRMQTGEEARTPVGLEYLPRTFTHSSSRTNAVTNFSPNPTNSGTIAAGDFLAINGSGFGGATGTVFFPNADDGGSTLVATGIATDYISWADAQIQVKVMSEAGTGTFSVNGSHSSPSPLTIDYAHIDINSNFSGFGVNTRQRFYLRNLNGSGGYTFAYNTSFATNVDAVAAFERALTTWRCATGVNMITAGTTSVAVSSADGTNAIYFDAALPAGVLGRATSNFQGSGNGGCNLQNTVWWLSDADIAFRNPPTGTHTWQFGPANPAISEFDFESVAVHEIGHAIGLGHRIAPGEVMHYAISNGTAIRTPSSEEFIGVEAKLAYSTVATCFNPIGSGSQMVEASPCTLPVSYSKFSGSRLDAVRNRLDWTTSSETSNAGFHIERSGEGRSFVNIGFVPSGTGLSPEKNYSFIDPQAGAQGWFYRLKQVDLNGSANYSGIVFVPSQLIPKWKIWYIRPAQQIQIKREQGSGVAELELVNSLGQIVLRKTIVEDHTLITTAKLSRGVYHYKLTSDSGQLSGSIVVN